MFLTETVETYALRDISLAVRPGEFVAIEGPSGCGKSTLLSLLGLLDVPTEGTYLLNGVETAGMSKRARALARNRQLGFVFQAFNLIGDLSVVANVELPLMYRGIEGEQRRVAAYTALERVGMVHRAEHFPAQLSGGQQQRVAVARAVVGNPAVLLADEPTGNLDADNGKDVMAMLSELNASGVTICMVTHDPRYASLATRAIQLRDGQIEHVNS